jgi:TldD protein
MFDELRRMLAKVTADYADIRYEVRRETRVGFNGRELTLMTSNSLDGYVVRVLAGGGLATIAFTRPADADDAIRTAIENAQIIGRNIPQPVRFAPAPAVKERYFPQLTEDPRRIAPEAKLELARRYNELALAAPAIAMTSTDYEDLVREKYFLNTEGSEVREDLVLNRVSGAIISQDGTLTQRVRFGFGGSNGFSVLRNREAELEQRAAVARDLLKAEPVTAGTHRVVLNQRLGGVFTHEAFGHFSEADIIEDSPTMRARMQIGAELGTAILNIKDDPTRPDQLGHYRFDDEGVLVGRLHSRRTAAAYGEPLSGHSVAEDYRYPPIIRMGCIFIEPGTLSFDDLLQRLGDGLYLCDPMGGQTSGENFTFAAQYGYIVRGGKQQQLVRDINMTGNLYETLKNISALADDLKLGEIGGCGKGQTNLRSCYGSPHVMIDRIVIGGR